MSCWIPQKFNLCLLHGILLLLCFLNTCCCTSNHVKNSLIFFKKDDTLLPATSPLSATEPLLPLLAPSPLSPFTNSTIPKLSGLCTLDFAAMESMMSMTAIDCVGNFAPYLANVICCPQVEANLIILIGQASKITNVLAINGSSSKPCLSDFEQILVGRGANDTLNQICSISPLNLTEGLCPVKDVNEFEKTVDTSNLLSACKKLDTVNECCEQVCQNSIAEAADKLVEKAYNLQGMESSRTLSDHTAMVNDCKAIALRWLAAKLEPSQAKEVLRGLSNCKLNKVCPLVFPNMSHVIKSCGDGLKDDHRACCTVMGSYVTHLQNQSFVTNLQALNCAASLGLRLQKSNITKNIYELCHVSLKDFSVQVTPQGVESGCLLPSLPSDAVFDSSAGLSFLCDLNDNIPAPWPSLSQLTASSCNKSIKIPALPAAASGQISGRSRGGGTYLMVILYAIWSFI